MSILSDDDYPLHESVFVSTLNLYLPRCLVLLTLEYLEDHGEEMEIHVPVFQFPCCDSPQYVAHSYICSPIRLFYMFFCCLRWFLWCPCLCIKGILEERKQKIRFFITPTITHARPRSISTLETPLEDLEEDLEAGLSSFQQDVSNVKWSFQTYKGKMHVWR